MTKRELLKMLDNFNDDDKIIILHRPPTIINDYQIFSVDINYSPYGLTVKHGNGTIEEYKQAEK